MVVNVNYGMAGLGLVLFGLGMLMCLTALIARRDIKSAVSVSNFWLVFGTAVLLAASGLIVTYLPAVIFMKSLKLFA